MGKAYQVLLLLPLSKQKVVYIPYCTARSVRVIQPLQSRVRNGSDILVKQPARGRRRCARPRNSLRPRRRVESGAYCFLPVKVLLLLLLPLYYRLFVLQMTRCYCSAVLWKESHATKATSSLVLAANAHGYYSPPEQTGRRETNQPLAKSRSLVRTEPRSLRNITRLFVG